MILTNEQIEQISKERVYRFGKEDMARFIREAKEGAQKYLDRFGTPGKVYAMLLAAYALGHKEGMLDCRDYMQQNNEAE